MNILFIVYTLLFASVISVGYAAVYFTFIKKQITLTNWAFILIGVLLLIQLEFTFTKGKQVNDKLSVEFKEPKDLYSTIVETESISDGVLYNHLLSMRAPFPKVILIQAKIESNNYKSNLYQKNNNMFGMKISTERVTTAGDGRAGYKSYINWKESVTDYILWQFSHNVDKLSQEEYITYLGKIYAEDPKYPSKIRAKLKEINFDKLEQ